jgi:hypothetical protein
MLQRLVLGLASQLLPEQTSGAAWHHRALTAVSRGDLAAARRLFAIAAERYRRELAVEPLARLRVHERMVRARDTGHAGSDELVEIVRLLNRLDRLESLEPPHALTDARTVLAAWIEGTPIRGDGSGAHVPGTGPGSGAGGPTLEAVARPA